MRASLALGLIAAMSACRSTSETTLDDSRVSRAIEPSPASAASSAEREPAEACDTLAWVDLARAREQPAIRAARERFMSKARLDVLGAAHDGGIDIEGAAREVTLCEHRGEGRNTNRLVVFDGEYGPDILNRLASVASGARMHGTTAGPLLEVGRSWIAAAPRKIIWSDARASLERALASKLPDGRQPGNFSLAVTTRGARLKDSFGVMARDWGSDPDEWQSFTLSVSADGASSDFRISMRSASQATELLDRLRRDVTDRPPGVHANDGDIVSTEATGANVSLRCRAPLDECLAALSRLQREHQRASAR